MKDLTDTIPSDTAPHRTTWFGVTTTGHLRCVGNAMTYDEADQLTEDLGIDCLWLIDEPTANTWKACLDKHLSPSPREA